MSGVAPGRARRPEGQSVGAVFGFTGGEAAQQVEIVISRAMAVYHAFKGTSYQIIERGSSTP